MNLFIWLLSIAVVCFGFSGILIHGQYTGRGQSVRYAGLPWVVFAAGCALNLWVVNHW